MEQHISHEKYSDLAHVELWINQRDLNQNLVDSIVKKQLEYYEKYHEFTFPGTLVIVHFNNTEYLIDGQHRFKALNILYTGHKCDITVAVQIYECNNKNQIDELYSMLNHINTDNCMVVDGKLDPDGEKLKQIKIRLKQKYGYKIWDDVKSIDPYINTKTLDAEFKNSSYFKSKTVDEIILRIEERNNNRAVLLKSENKNKYDKMMKDGGFVLQCGQPKARWVKTLF